MKFGKSRQTTTGPGGLSGVGDPPTERVAQDPSRPASETPEAIAMVHPPTEASGSARTVADLEARLLQQQARLDIQRRELEESRAALTAREAELDAQQLEIDRRQAELEEQRREITLANQRLVEARAEVQRLSESLEAKYTGSQVDRLTEFYQQQHAELDAERRQIETLHDQIRRERAELAADRHRVEEWQAALERRAADLDQKAEQLEADRRELARQRQELAPEEARISQERTQLERVQTELARRRQQLDQEGLELRSERDRLAAQREQLDQQRASLTAEQAALATRAEGIEKQRAALTAQREQLAERQNQVEGELARLNETRERLEKEGEQHRAELRKKLDQLEGQLTQVTERGQQLAARQRELDEREAALRESERRAAAARVEWQTEREAAQALLDERRRQIEDQERRIAEAHAEYERRAALLTQQIEAFAADRERILRMQSRFDAQAEELRARESHLDRVKAELDQQRDQIETQRAMLEPKLQDLREQASQLDRQRQALTEENEKLLRKRQEIEQQLEKLAAAQADLERRRSQADAAASEIQVGQREIAEERKRLADEAARLEADSRRFEHERQDAAHQVAEERQMLDQRREELARQAADLTEREHRLAAEVESLREIAERTQEGLGDQPVVIQVGGFNLRRALTASALLAAAAAIAVVLGIGLRREVQGVIHITTEVSPEDVLAQYADLLRSQPILTTAAQELDADVSADEIRNMMGPGGELEVRAFPDEGQIRLRAVTTNPQRAQAIIDALGTAMKAHINKRSGAPNPPPAELQELQAEKARREEARNRAAEELAAAQKSVQTQRPDPPLDEVEKQLAAALQAFDAARQAAAAAQQQLSMGAASRPVVEVDSTALRRAFSSDAQLQQDGEQFRLREQQLRGYLLDGLNAARAPLAALSEKIQAFDREVVARAQGRPAEDVQTILRRIRTELMTCRDVTAEVIKGWDDQLQRLRQQDAAAGQADMLGEQHRAEKMLSEFLDRLSQPIVAINNQIQAITPVSGQDTTGRTAIQDALKRRADDLTSARREFANVGAEIMPMSNPRLNDCLKEVGQLRNRLAERQRQIAEELKRRIEDQTTGEHAKRLEDLTRQAAEWSAARDRTWEEVLKWMEEARQARVKQTAFERQQVLAELAGERLRTLTLRVSDVDRQIEECRKRAAAATPAQRRDTADFLGVSLTPGLANQRQLTLSALGAAVFVFAMTWSVTWLVSNGRSPPARDGSRRV